MKSKLIAFSLGLALATGAFAQTDIVTDEDALFGGEEESIEVVKTGSEGAALQAFLKTEAVRIGGSFSGSIGADWKMYEPWTAPSLDEYGLDTTVAGSLFFDARPDEDFRVYGKVKTTWPFQSTKSFLTATAPAPTYGSITVPNLQVFELFADWSYKDNLFLRFGKHTVKWGVGYFFSPADVINLGAIDVLDPTAQREGPVSLRIHYPVLGTQTNLWAYAILPQDANPKPEDIAGAAKLEFLLAKSWEIGIGGYYKYDHPPRAVLTASGGFWKLNLFGEAVGSWGSDKDFVTAVDDALVASNFISSEQRKEELFFSGTVGLSYSNSTDNWSLAAQYLYNGEGYADSEREGLIDQARSEEIGIRAALAGLGLPDSAFSSFLKGLIYNSGRHYAAASLSKSELFVEDLSVSLFAMANLSDFSGFATPTISWELFDKASLSLSATFVFGAGDSEYIVLNDGAALSLGLKASLGTGNF